jgi:hypothetical protein
MTQIPKLADILTPELDNLKTVELLIEGFEMRMEAEEIYEKSLAKVSMKFSTGSQKTECYGLLIG